MLRYLAPLIVGISIVLPPVARAQATTDPGAESICLTAPASPLASSGIGGTAQLCSSGSNTSAEMHVDGLAPEHVYTTWLVYFDTPGACATTPCTGADALGDDPVAVFTRMDGVVADATGATEFSGVFRDLRLSAGSEIWLLMFGHGLVNREDKRMLARQLLTPQSPKLGAPGAGAMADGEIGTGVARAVFTIPTSVGVSWR